MNWAHCFAEQTRGLKRSTVRELLKVTTRPDIISFAGGLPATELFPIDRVREAVDSVLARLGGRCLQYGETEGVVGLREWIAQAYSRGDLRVKPQNILITTGAQQALDLLGRLFLEPGDRVLVENPTYLALLANWRSLGAQFDTIPALGDSDSGREALDKAPWEAAKLAYVMPTFQNPSGRTYSLSERKLLLGYAKKYSVPLVEDDPYGELRYEGSPLPHLFDLDSVSRTSGEDSCVIYTGTFSKVLVPGLRVGWVIAPDDVIEKLVQIKQSVDLHTSTLSQYVALELLAGRFLPQHLSQLRRCYAERRDVMLRALEMHFPPEARWNRPEGGMFLFVCLLESIDTTQLLVEALEQQVAFVPGEGFHLDGAGRNTMRLNFSNAQPTQIEKGIQRLGELIKARGFKASDSLTSHSAYA